jgi:membrane protein DedA with SNARE-associated domain
LISFALSNRDPARVGLWPLDATLEMPLSLLVLTAAATAFLVGALFVWVGAWSDRRRLRRTETRVALLEEELRAAQARLAAAGSPAVTPPGNAP